MASGVLDRMKIILRESDVPFFTDEELNFYLSENNGNINDALYECLLVKSEDTTLQISGMSAADSSSYFKRLASKYRPSHSGSLYGG